MQPLTLGTNKANYAENSPFNHSSIGEKVITAYGGARLLLRHNTSKNAHIGFHGFDDGNRSAHSSEILRPGG